MRGETGKRICAFLFYCLVASSVLFIPALYDSYQLAKSASFALLLCLLFFAMFLARSGARFNPLLLFPALFMLYMASRSFDVSNNPQSFYILTMFAPASFFAGLAAPRSRVRFLALVHALCAASSLLGLYQFVAGAVRPYSFFGNPVFFSEFLAMNLPLLAVSFFLIPGKKLLLFVSLLLSLAGLFISGSRGAAISALVSCAVLAAYLLRAGAVKMEAVRPHLKKLSAALVIFLVTLIILPGVFDALRYNAKRLGQLASLSSPAVKTRILMSKAAFGVAKGRLLYGAGPGGYRMYYQAEQKGLLKQNPGFDFVNTSYAHNDYLQLLAEYGLTGLLLFVLAVTALFWLFDRRAGAMDDDGYILSLALAASLGTVLMESFFNFPLFIMPSAGLFWIYAGMLADTALEKDAPAPSWAPAAVSLALCALISTAFVMRLPSIAADMEIKNGLNRMTVHAKTERDSFTRAAELDPRNFYAWFYLGYSYGMDPEHHLQDSAAAYQKALEIYPHSADVWYNLASVYRAQKDNIKAENAVERALDYYPSFGLAHAELGRIYMDTGRDALAAEQFALARQNDPSAVEAGTYNRVMLFEEITAPRLETRDKRQK